MNFRATVELSGRTATGIAVPADLSAALAEDVDAQHTFELCAPSYRKEWVRWIEEAKKPETRATRIEKAVAALHDGKRTR